MQFRSNLSLFSSGVELHTQFSAGRLLGDRLEHLPLANNSVRRPARPLLVGDRNTSVYCARLKCAPGRRACPYADISTSVLLFAGR